MNDGRIKHLTPLAALLLPVALLKGAAMLLGAPGPMEVAGYSTDTDMLPSSPRRSQGLTTEQLSAILHLDTMVEKPFGASPMYYEIPQGTVVAGPDIDPTDHLPIMIAPPDVTLSAVMQTARGNIALIGNELMIVGSRLTRDSSWILMEVNLDAGRATLVHEATETEHVLWLRDPEASQLGAPMPPLP